MILFLMVSCAPSFYTELKKGRSIFSDTYYNPDTVLVIKDYIICYNTYRPTTDLIDENFSDSIRKIFQLSLKPLGISIINEQGSNIYIDDYCSRQEAIRFRHISYEKLFQKSSFDDSEKTYLFPFIRIKESPGMRNTYDWTYTPRVNVQIIIWIIKNNDVIYEKNISAGPILSEQSVMKVWGEYDSYPEKQFEQAHWDTLVGLGMKEYIERLNRIE